MRRIATYFILALALAVFAGCPGDDPVVPPPTDTGDVSVDAGDEGKQPDQGGDETTDPDKPTLKCQVRLAPGWTNFGPPNSLDLVEADEPANYAASPGFQLDFQVTATDVGPGQPLRLIVDGAVDDSANLDSNGEGAFTNYTLKVGETVVILEAETSDGTIARCEATTFTLTEDEPPLPKPCDVELAPAPPAGGACVTEDADEAAPGTQLIFTVTNPNGECEEARLHFTWGGDEAVTDAVALTDGAASFTIEVPAEFSNGGALTVSGEVMPTDETAIAAQTEDATHVIDVVPPAIVITQPDVKLLSAGDDLDEEEDDLQFNVSGVMEQASPGDVNAVVVTGCGSEIQAVPNDNGEWSVLLTCADGVHMITVTGTDGCGLSAEPVEIEVTVTTIPATIAVTSPETKTLLLAADDGDKATPTDYELTFYMTVAPEPLVFPYTLTVECGAKDGPSKVAVGSQAFAAVPADGLYAVDAVLEQATSGNDQVCVVRDDAINPSSSGEVILKIGLPAPSLVILAPEEGAHTSTPGVPLTGATQHLDYLFGGKMRLFDADELMVWENDWPAYAVNDGFSFSANLTQTGAAGSAILADGVDTLVMAISDEFGNPACDHPDSDCEVQVVLDTTAPTVEIYDPDVASLVAADDQNAASPGFQYQFGVKVDDGGNEAGSIVCLSVGAVEHGCVGVEEGQTVVVFPDVTLQPGDNTLSAIATDKAGNQTTPAVERVYYLDSAAPSVKISKPAGKTSTAFPTIDITVDVTDKNFLPIDTALVSPLVDGAPAAFASVTPLGGGQYLVEGVDLGAPGIHMVAAQAEVDTLIGVSGPVEVNYKEDAPAITLNTLTDGVVLNKASSLCTPGKKDCELSIVCVTAAVDDLSEASLTYDCGVMPITLETGYFVIGSKVTFSSVPLTNNATCMLSCAVTDKGTGQTAESPTVTVKVDRTSPTLKFVTPAKDKLTFVDDLEPGGLLSYVIQVGVTGLEVGESVVLTISPEPMGGNPAPKVMTKTVSDTESATLGFAKVELDAGTYSLTATTLDAAGNAATPLKKNVVVELVEAEIRISTPTYVDPVDCESHAACGGGVCAGGKCATGWSAASNRSINVVSSTMPDLPNNVRVCTNHPSYSDQPACGASGAGFHQVALTTMTGTLKDVDVSAAVDGIHMFVAERKKADGSWVSSLSQDTAALQSRRIFIDTFAPTVQATTLPDDEAPFGCLTAEENSGVEGKYQAQVTCDADGQVELFHQGVTLGKMPAQGGQKVTYELPLIEGLNALSAICSDVVGNLSASVPFTAELDTTAPELTFTKPTKTKLLAGDDLSVELASDAIGREVALVSTVGGLLGTQVVSADGKVVFADVLAQGKQTLTATVEDACGNTTAQQTDELHVDTLPPTLTLMEPAATVSLVDADDADPGAGGFQVQVQIATGGDAFTWSIRLKTGCGAAFATCGDGTIVASGTVTIPDGEEPPVMVTLPISNAPDYFVIEVATADEAGNTVKAESQLTVTLSECAVSFKGLPIGAVGNALCVEPGTDCDSIELNFEVMLAGPCLGIGTIDLYEGDTKVDEAAVVDSSASFTRTFDHNAKLELEAKGVGTDKSTGKSVLDVDLKDPVPVFFPRFFGYWKSPASDTEVTWLAEDDRSADAGFQIFLHLEATDDGLGGTEVTALKLADGADIPSKTSLPLPFTLKGAKWEADFLFAVVPEALDQTVVATVVDAAGNEATTSFDYDADITPPAALELTLDSFNRRRPTVNLSWSAVADDGAEGEAAAEYQVRFSKKAITEASFDKACDATLLLTAATLPVPGIPGAPEAYTITGPDARGPGYSENGEDCHYVLRTGGESYYFAARAVDALGNVGPVTAGSVIETKELGLRAAKLAVGGAMASKDFDGRASYIGDINNDGFGDFALGGGTHGGAPTGRMCIFYGSAQATVPDLTIDPAVAPSGAGYQCILDAPRRFGFPAKSVGDVNGDGLLDLGVPAGRYNEDPNQLRIYLGVDGGQISTTPALVVTGMIESSLQARFGGGGNFNGDVTGEGLDIDDLIIGSRNELTSTGRAYLVPGAASWPAATLDLQKPEDLAAFSVQTIELKDSPASTQFGGHQNFAGDILTDEGGSYDEVVIAAYASEGTTRAYLLKGRPISGAATLQMSEEHDGSAPEDANSVLLLPDGGPNNFADDSITNVDVDGDGILDVFLQHSKNQAYFMLYLYSGAAIQESLGGTLKLNAAAEQVGDGQHLADDGVIFGGEGTGGPAYAQYASVGNVADDPAVDVDPIGIGFRHYSAGDAGVGYIRLNTHNPGAGLPFGTFPWVDIELFDPFDPASGLFAYRNVVGVGDFNGDGLDDVLVSTNGSGYVVLLY